jgi:Methyltransferase domain
VHWSFWPTTVFTYRAVRELCEVLQYKQLQDILNRTRIFASEEIIFPTLVALLGFEIEENPCNSQFVKYKVSYTPRQLDDALRIPNAYWLHPVPRQYNAPLRQALRAKCNNYESLPNRAKAVAGSVGRPLLLTLPILRQIRHIEGWLDDEEADLLISTTAKALERTPGGGPSVVEVGSYCGKGTVVLGLTIKGVGHPTARVYAIDPHDGRVGAYDQGITQTLPTFDKFRRNIREAGVADLIAPVRAHSYELAWDKPIALLFIDGLHDYPNVARDFYHFANWVQPGGFAVFHDYADYFPGVMKFVDALVNTGEYQALQRVKSLIVLEKR